LFYASTCLLPAEAKSYVSADHHTVVFHVHASPGKSLKVADIPVKGTVRDDKGEAIPGTSVLIKGTNTGTITDASGGFTINVPSEESVLIISFIGYESQEIRVGNKTNLDIKLALSNTALDEVVVIGYGTAQKSDLTGSVTSVKEMELKERPAPSLNQALAGRWLVYR
jgi:hypothetical protein